MPKSFNLRCPVCSSGDPAWSWVRFPFRGTCPLPFPFSYGLVVTLPFLRWVCPFTNVFVQSVLWWIALCVLLFVPTLRFLVANSPTTIAVSSKTSLLTMLGLESASFVHLTFVPAFSIMFSALVLFLRAFPNRSHESSLTLVITRKLLGCIPVIFNFLGNLFSRAQTGLDSTSNAVECPVVQFCSCKLPFEFLHSRVHRFLSRSPQHYCSIVED